MSEYILEVAGLSKQFEAFALKDVHIQLPYGFIMGFIGKNGAGKSTTIKCMMNLIHYDRGTIRLFGEDHSNEPERLRQRIGYVGEEVHFYEHMSVDWTERFVSGFYDRWDTNKFQALLRRFEVPKHKKIKELSKGMKVKLWMALALAHNPELIILDEPTSGLDPVVRSELLDVLREEIQNERCSIFFSSHITNDIEKIADYVAMIDQGSIIMSDEKDRLLERWSLVKADGRYADESILRLLKGVKKTDFGFSGLTEDIRAFDQYFKRTFAGAVYKAERVTLDELMVRLVKEGQPL